MLTTITSGIEPICAFSFTHGCDDSVGGVNGAFEERVIGDLTEVPDAANDGVSTRAG